MFGAFVAVDAEHTGATEEEAQLNFEADVQRKLAIDKQTYNWDEEFPTEYDEWSRDQGRTLFFSWNTRTTEGDTIRWGEIADGRYDDDIDTLAAALKAFAAPAFFQFAHEPETLPDAGTPQDFIDAFRYVRNALQARGVTNLSYVLTLMAFTFRMGNADQYYPGNNYVDVLGADGFNWYECPGREDDWTRFSDVFGAFYDYGLAKGKPMALAEWGSHEDYASPGRKGRWIQDASDTLKGWPQIKVISYFHESTGCEWWVDSSSSSLRAFIEMGADPYFNPPPPLVTITSGPSDPSNSITATFVFSANIPGTTFTCSLDGRPSLPCLSPITYPSLSQGQHTVTITGTESGLSGSVRTTWTVDSIPPILTVEGGPSGDTNSDKATFHLISTELVPPGWFTCKLDLGAVVECPAWQTYADLGDGSHTFTAVAYDEAGNASLPVIRTWVVDTKPPTATITSGPPNPSPSRSATFIFRSNEPGSTFKCKIDAGSYGACTSPHTYDWLSDGRHTFSVIAVDLAGNSSSPASWTWTIDT